MCTLPLVNGLMFSLFFCKQKTAYEMRISDWNSDVCSSDLTDPWTRKYICPGGYSPALSEVLPAIEQSWLWVTDVEVLRLHYAYTIEHWYARARAARDRIVALYDERFYRM